MIKSVAAQFAERLDTGGVRRIFGVDDDGLNGRTDSFRRRGRVKWVHVRHNASLDLAKANFRRLS
jgi:pyruvate dehydrogenase (quinone)